MAAHKYCLRHVHLVGWVQAGRVATHLSPSRSWDIPHKKSDCLSDCCQDYTPLKQNRLKQETLLQQLWSHAAPDGSAGTTLCGFFYALRWWGLPQAAARLPPTPPSQIDKPHTNRPHPRSEAETWQSINSHLSPCHIIMLHSAAAAAAQG